MVALRSWDQHVWDPRPVPHETEAEIRPITVRPRLRPRPKKWSRDHVGRPRWSQDLNILDHCMQYNNYYLCSARKHSKFVLQLSIVTNS